MERRNTASNRVVFLALFILAALFLAPVLVVLMNSFKGRFYISETAFLPPTGSMFVGLDNYFNGVDKTAFFNAFGYSLYITVFAVLLICLFNSMAAWYITRIKSTYSSALYYLLIFSMIVPFQMVMFTMSKMADMLHLDTPTGVVVLYVGFGAGLSVFMFSGFIKSVPIDIEEAAMIDGCNPIQVFFRVVFPILQPVVITVAILIAMWTWNDYLLPYLVIGQKYRTIPIAVQYLRGGYGSKDMGAMMAVLVLSMIPVIVFYLSCQKYIIRGVVAGAVKG
ncbi:L-arabinose transport system permease protein AraQ [Caprobacter fermentans]|uniref:L-arabinose transport system permease protein AraQ n=1 Tax=Caproicibacter fermentans TaxID=2576756 RepID=A0A6N8I412_9FIRM|nr:carbohydrate ABC transporter permease [Caproicibacter fermentans]MVB12685.1 L-arabinose transport system permease protein AraQ [Caproicibacter fermentans]OCN02240.1 sugar ABC transporter permease [Clostridium sp. W14A]